jgi:hypothetical protein
MLNIGSIHSKMNKENSTSILLKKLTMKEHQEIFQLSKRGLLFSDFLQDLKLDENKSIAFTQRLLWLSKGHYSVRPQNQPKKVIGYTLFYKSGKSYYDGLCLLPEYYFPSVVDQIYEQLLELAKFCCGVQVVNKKRFVFPVKENLLRQRMEFSE